MAGEAQNYLLDLLDQAYETADDPARLDALLDNAGQYLFEDQKQAIISGNFPRFADFDPYLERHIERFRKVLEQRGSTDSPGLSLGHHAQLIVSPFGKILTANTAANEILVAKKNAFIDGLKIDSNSLMALRDLLKQLQAGVQSLERIIYLGLDTDPAQSAFGYCRAVPVGDQTIGLHITLTFFEWSPALYHSVQQALDLSDSETEVLAGVLSGNSQKQIAKKRGRSIDTVKSQCKSILQKSGCKKMTEVTHLCTSIAYIVGLSRQSEILKSTGDSWITPKQNLFKMKVSDRRTLAWYEYGDPQGQAVLFIHGFFQGPYFTDEFKHGLLENGLRIIAPSRPSFGYTSHSNTEAYDQTVLDDNIALMDNLNLNDITLAVHHGGVSHAFRLAGRQKEKIRNMVMIGAGVPVTQEHLKYMDREKRMISAAARHAPSLLNLITTVGIKTYHKKGVQAFLSEHYAPRPIDKKILTFPEVNQVVCEGLYHLVQQGGEAFVHDGRSQMTHWDEDFKAVSCPQHWLIARHCHLMKADIVETYVEKPNLRTTEIIEEAGYNILYQAQDRVIEALLSATIG